MLVDAHLHLWDAAIVAPPWLANVPRLAGRFDLARYRAEGGRAEAAVLVEADVAVADRGREAAMLSEWGRLFAAHAVVAGIEPGAGSFAEELGWARSTPATCGGRRVLHGGQFRASERFIADLRSLASANLSFDFCVRCADLPEVIRCLRAVPELRAIVDHLGNPPIRAGWDSDAAASWRRDIADVATCRNAVVKLSAMFENAGGAIEVAEARPWVDWCLARFGPQRLLWGSNWPVCFIDAPLVAWLELTQSLVGDLSTAEQAAVLGENAARTYRLGVV